jgi:hypothetical protein
MVSQPGEKKLICIGVHGLCQSKVSHLPQAPHFESHPGRPEIRVSLIMLLLHEGLMKLTIQQVLEDTGKGIALDVPPLLRRGGSSL